MAHAATEFEIVKLNTELAHPDSYEGPIGEAILEDLIERGFVTPKTEN